MVILVGVKPTSAVSKTACLFVGDKMLAEDATTRTRTGFYSLASFQDWCLTIEANLPLVEKRRIELRTMSCRLIVMPLALFPLGAFKRNRTAVFSLEN